MPHKLNSGGYVIFTDQPEGNSIGIMAIVSDWLRQIHGHGAESDRIIEEYCNKAMSGDYENLKKVSIEAVPGLLTFGLSTDYSITAKRKDNS